MMQPCFDLMRYRTTTPHGRALLADVCDRVRSQLDATGRSKEWLGEQFDVTPVMVDRWLAGECLDLGLLVDIADVLGIQLCDLIEGDLIRNQG